MSARVARLLSEEGHDAVHVGALSLLGAVDTDVMEAARHGDRILVSADTDFGELLALGNHARPSVVLFRRAPHSPEQQAHLLLGTLPDIGDDLSQGAVVVLRPDRVRIRRLPMRPEA